MYSPRTPEWNLGLGMQYEFRVGGRGATLVPRFDYTWQDDIWFATNPVAGIVNEQDGRQPAYGVLNGARHVDGAGRELVASRRTRLNLTDEYYFYGKLSLLANSGREQGNPAPPRELGRERSATTSERCAKLRGRVRRRTRPFLFAERGAWTSARGSC